MFVMFKNEITCAAWCAYTCIVFNLEYFLFEDRGHEVSIFSQKTLNFDEILSLIFHVLNYVFFGFYLFKYFCAKFNRVLYISESKVGYTVKRGSFVMNFLFSRPLIQGRIFGWRVSRKKGVAKIQSIESVY